VGLVGLIKTVCQLTQVVTATEKFAFQQPPKYRHRRCILYWWRQTVPDVRTGDTECTVANGSPSRPRGVQSGWSRGSQPSAWLQAQGCHRPQLVSKVWRSSSMETTENEHRKFELNDVMWMMWCHMIILLQKKKFANFAINWTELLQELSYPKQIARQLRTQFVEGISVTLKSTLRVTQGHWKRNHWTDHIRLTIRRVIGRWILSW